MTSDESELLTRIDERVKRLCDNMDTVLEKQGELDARTQKNESDIEKNNAKIHWNRYIMSGILITVLAGIILASFGVSV